MVALQDQMPVVSQDPTDNDFVQNPYEFYRKVRAAGNFVFWKEYDLPVAVTQDAVAQVLRHPQFGRAVPPALKAEQDSDLKPFYDVEEHSLLELEPPDHTRIRRIVASGFAMKRMAPLAPKISQVADMLINSFPDGEFDLLDAFAKPLTAQSIAMFLGLDPSHAHQLERWSTAMVAMYQARRDAAVEQAAVLAATEFTEFVNRELDARSGGQSDDFLTELLAAEQDGMLSRSELISTVILLLNAGQEATAHAVGNAVRNLISYPDRMLAFQPEHIANTVEECLRFSPPLHLFNRYVYQRVSLLGLDIPAGAQIGCLLGSSCRDDAVWPDGEKFDPFRIRRTHQAFGVGLHACTGASLARLELQIAVPALFSRCPELTFASPPRVANLYHFHGLEAINVRLR